MGKYDLEDVLEVVQKSDFPALTAVAEALAALHGWTFHWSDVFEATRRAREAVEHLEREAVRWARLDHLSWEDIGEELRISGAGARKRYARTGRDDLEELDALDDFHEAETKAFFAELQLASARARNELRAMFDTKEQLEQAVMDRVMKDEGYGARMMQLIDVHLEARRELVRRLEEDD